MACWTRGLAVWLRMQAEGKPVVFPVHRAQDARIHIDRHNMPGDDALALMQVHTLALLPAFAALELGSRSKDRSNGMTSLSQYLGHIVRLTA